MLNTYISEHSKVIYLYGYFGGGLVPCPEIVVGSVKEVWRVSTLGVFSVVGTEAEVAD